MEQHNIPTKTKVCTGCREALPLSAFNRAKNGLDGHAPKCRACTQGSRKLNGTIRQVNAIRAAIKQGDFQGFQKHFSTASEPPEKLLAMAVQDYNTAQKHVGHLKIIDFLIQHGAKPQRAMIFEAVRSGSIESVNQLLAAGIDRDIFVCSAVGDTTHVKSLLKKQPELAQASIPHEARAYVNFTPLHICCASALGRRSPGLETKLLETAKQLVDCGADVNAKATFYGTLIVVPLDMLGHSGGNTRLAEYLIEREAEITSFAVGEALSHRGRSLAEGLALAELFVEHGFQIDSPYKNGTLLNNAANTGNTRVVEWLLGHGASLNARGRLGRTALHLAAERNTSTKTIELLVSRGIDIDAKDDQGLTAFDVAVKHGKTAVADWLRSSVNKKPCV